MAKIHQNAEKFPIRWNGNVEGGENQGDSIPSDVNITWGGRDYPAPYTPCWDDGNGGIDGSQCTTVMEDLFLEDLDINQPGNGVDVLDAVAWISQGRSDITNYIVANINGIPNKSGTLRAGGSNTFTWGDVSFIQEIVDGIGTGSRRARQDRLNKILDDEDKKKKLIHLICRIKGEKVYDDYTEVGSVEVDVDDVELVVEKIMGKKLTLEIKSGV